MDIFLYGTLCYNPLLKLVLGFETTATSQPARLSGYQVFWAKDADYPAIVKDKNGHVDGILLSGITLEERARFDFYEAGFGYALEHITVEAEGKTHSAECYFPKALPELGDTWDLELWAQKFWPITRHSATEIMGYFGHLSCADVHKRLGMILTRASSRERAERMPAPTTLRSSNNRELVQVLSHQQAYSGFFTLDETKLAYPRFDGSMSDTIERSGFVAGDAAFVLPYDPKTDLVMVIEQFRYGAFARHDPNPWVLEPIAGRIDAHETPETCARREAVEEAGISLRSLEHVASYYPSPGSVSEFFYTYIGLADLAPEMAGIGGLAEESEDIRSHVISFTRLMELVSSGEAGAGPLVLCALWLSANRSRLRSLA